MSEGERSLAAIMFTDIAGYTALAQRDEGLAMKLLEEHRALVRPYFPKHGGREVKTIGDAFLVEFGSALEAVRCAYDAQQSLHELNQNRPLDRSVQMRIGIHLGDVIHSQGDVYGDAVNVASRIEPFATPGGVCISGQVHDHVKNKLEFPMVSLGRKELKNVGEAVEVFRVILPWETGETPAQGLDRNRVAVLPFANMSPDPGDEYFADGLTEEVIERLCHVKGLEVIARTSAMSYKKKGMKAAEIGRELRTGSLVEGSVRKAGSKIRVTAQLIDANTDGHLWSSKYDRDLEDIFAVQSDIAEQVAGALQVQLFPADIDSIRPRRTESTEAYTLYLRGRQLWNRRSREAVEQAITCFTRASEADPDFALAYAGLADCYNVMENWGYAPTTEMRPLLKWSVEKALSLDDNLAEAHTTRALMLALFEWKWSEAELEFNRAIELNPNYASAHQLYAYTVLRSFRRADEEMREAEKALELDPLAPVMSLNKGQSLFMQERYDEAIECYERALSIDPSFLFAKLSQADCHLRCGRYDKAVSMAEACIPAIGWSESKQKLSLAWFYGFAGRSADARRLLAEATSKEDKLTIPTDLAAVHLALGETDLTLDYLELAYKQKDTALPWALTEPISKPLQSDPRLQELKIKVGIAAKSL